MRTLLAILLLAGCGDPLSNQLFEEDELFSAALPVEEDLVTDHPRAEGADEERDVGEEALLPPIARGVSADINGTVFFFLGVVDSVRQRPITTRERDRRVWGPYERGEGEVRLVVERAEDAVFSYRLDADVGDGWQILMEGDFLRGESLRDGEGAFSLHADVLESLSGGEGAGVMDVEHSRLGGSTSLRVVRTGWARDGQEPRDIDYYFQRFEQGGGVFEYRAEADLFEGDALEMLATRAHWGLGGRGRGDFRTWGGDLGAAVRGSECWDRGLDRLFWRLELPAGDETEGLEEDCVFERQDPRELLGEGG